MTEVVSLPSVVDVTFSNASSGMEGLFRYVDFMRGVHTLQIDVEFGYDIMELAEIIIDLHHIKSLKLHGITNATDFNLADFFAADTPLTDIELIIHAEELHHFASDIPANWMWYIQDTLPSNTHRIHIERLQ